MIKRRRNRDESGSMAVELALLAIPIVIILLLVTALGRFSDARNQINEAARDAARQASTYLSPVLATSQANQIASSELTGACARHNITVDTSDLHPGGQVTVSVVCDIPLDDLTLLKLPGTKTIDASSKSVVDTYVQSSVSG
jgi:Flp pilus assembly protein TadG